MRARQGSAHWARLFEKPRVAGTEPAGRKQTERRCPSPALAPLSGIQLCSAGVGSGLAWLGPPVPALIGQRRGQPRGRHAPGPCRADKACQGAHDSWSRKSAWSRSRAKTAAEAREPGPLRVSFGGLGGALKRRSWISAALADAETSSAPRCSPLPPLRSLPCCAQEQGKRGSGVLSDRWEVAPSHFLPAGPRDGELRPQTDPR